VVIVRTVWDPVDGGYLFRYCLLVQGRPQRFAEVQVQPDTADGEEPSLTLVLVHGFGGGVFQWRHLMEGLALRTQARVVAFDRPAFGGSHGCHMHENGF